MENPAFSCPAKLSCVCPFGQWNFFYEDDTQDIRKLYLCGDNDAIN